MTLSPCISNACAVELRGMTAVVLPFSNGTGCNCGAQSQRQHSFVFWSLFNQQRNHKQVDLHLYSPQYSSAGIACKRNGRVGKGDVGKGDIEVGRCAGWATVVHRPCW
jgi:hypothetical protein